VKKIEIYFLKLAEETKSKLKINLMEVIVQKKINERFFMPSSRGLTNPSSGTVVCEETVSKKLWDFYLVAQKVTQGTCTPTKYTVIHNNVNIR
jgi:aubergine-like protein